MTKQFEVSANGTIFGVYAGENEQEARDNCAIDAGYKSEAEMDESLETASELIAIEINA